MKSITEAVQSVHPGASVSADLATKRVVIGGKGDPHAFMAAIEEAGFTVKAAE